MISKKQLSTYKIETIREYSRIYKLAIHPYIIKLEDFFENKNFFHICFELLS